MNNQDFLKPRLQGKRFQHHSLPLELLKDLAALEEMVMEVAKHEFFVAHQDRERIPRGFSKGLELHLSGIEEGSVIPVITLAFASFFSPQDVEYFNKAKAKIIAAIAAAEQGTKQVLPPDLLKYFDRFGRSLLSDESMVFDLPNGQSAALTPQVRDSLLRASEAKTWTEAITLKGRIPKVDQARGSFGLELVDGTNLKAPMDEQHLNIVLEASYGYRKGTGVLVAIQAVVERDRAGRKTAIQSVEHITLLNPLDIETRLQELALLKNGWLDGKGKELDQKALQLLAHTFDEQFSPDLPLPYLYPTPEGGIQAEWTLGNWEVSLEISLPDLSAEYQTVNINSGESRELQISLANKDKNAPGFAELNKALEELQKGKA